MGYVCFEVFRLLFCGRLLLFVGVVDTFGFVVVVVSCWLFAVAAFCLGGFYLFVDCFALDFVFGLGFVL